MAFRQGHIGLLPVGTLAKGLPEALGLAAHIAHLDVVDLDIEHQLDGLADIRLAGIRLYPERKLAMGIGEGYVVILFVTWLQGRTPPAFGSTYRTRRSANANTRLVPSDGKSSTKLGQLPAWTRLHYVYPYPFVRDLIPLMADGLILPYLNIPFQHAHPDTLKRMARPAAAANPNGRPASRSTNQGMAAISSQPAPANRRRCYFCL